MPISNAARTILRLALVTVLVRLSDAWAVHGKESLHGGRRMGHVDCLRATVNPENASTRRTYLKNIVTSCSIAALSYVPICSALALPQEEKDKANIRKGYQRLNYLLDNWEKETTICNTSNDNPYLGCDRTPMKVMEYLGFKNTEDPLFKADKIMLRLQQLVPAQFEDEYLEAMETWVEKSEEGSGMAYVSSWGESNPGGGKDRVAMFIERSKRDVIACRDSLGTVIRVLEL